MKKEHLFIVSVITMVAFSSCQKDDGVMPSVPPVTEDNSNTAGRTVVDPLTTNLEGRFEFDGNLREKTGKLPTGIPTSRGADVYTDDRKGNAKKALFLNGDYGIRLSNILQKTNSSLSVWLLVSNFYPEGQGWPVYGKGPVLAHDHTESWLEHYHEYHGGVVLDPATNNNPFVSKSYNPGPYFFGWHHFAVTFNGNTVTFYIDGVAVGTNSSFPATIPAAYEKYQLGFSALADGFWTGGIDDLRFYSRTLTANDVSKLSAL